MVVLPNITVEGAYKTYLVPSRRLQELFTSKLTQACEREIHQQLSGVELLELDS
jgi:hypothetical protein